MRIDHYELYEFNYKNGYFIECGYEDVLDAVTEFLKSINSYESAIWYYNQIKNIQTLSKPGTDAYSQIVVDYDAKIVYLIMVDIYDIKDRTHNLNEAALIQRCLQNEAYYSTMSYYNFCYLVCAWIEILKIKPEFAMLYQDEKGWIDLMPFRTEHAMKEFVTLNSHFNLLD
jgi:hypothetical protein